MKVFITGATGYIGGSVSAKFLAMGHEVIGLTRSSEKAIQLEKLGIKPIIADLSDVSVIRYQALEADAVINAADADNILIVDTLLDALKGTSKTFIHTSGSSIVGDKAAGVASTKVYSDYDIILPVDEKKARYSIDKKVMAAIGDVRSLVICPTMIYGEGLGLHKDSIQIPMIFRDAQKHGIARHIGIGENIWSNVHIHDLADLYFLAFEKAKTGDFFFAENGENSIKDIASLVNQVMGLERRTESIDQSFAIKAWGYEPAVFALGSNSRVRGDRARKTLGWQPSRPSLEKSFESTTTHLLSL